MGRERDIAWEARHFDSGVLYMERIDGHDTKTWCFYSERGGMFVGQVGYPWIDSKPPFFAVPVSEECFRRRYRDAGG